MHNFRKLEVWKLSMRVASETILLIETLPQFKRYGLAGQLERTVVSVPSNIAEGAGRKSIKEYLHFLNIAYASSYELETQLLIAQDVNFCKDVDVQVLLDKVNSVQKMLFRLVESISKNAG